jgi:hypothetical protein
MPGFSAYSGSLTINATYVNIGEALNAVNITANFDGATIDFTNANLININTNATSKWTDGLGTDIYRLSNVGVNTSSIGQTLTVAGNASVSSYLTVGANLNVGTTANIVGATALGSTLNVAGTANVIGATSLNSTLTVAGQIDLNNTVNITGNTNLLANLRVGQTVLIEGLTTIYNDLDVIGSSYEINKRHSNGGTRVRLYESANDGLLELYRSGNVLTTRLHSDGASYFTGGAVGVNTSIIGVGNDLEVVGTTATTNLSATNVNATTAILTTANATTINGGTLVLSTALTANNPTADFRNSTIDFTDAGITGLAGDWLANGSTIYYTAGGVAIGTDVASAGELNVSASSTTRATVLIGQTGTNTATILMDGSNGDFAGLDYFNITAESSVLDLHIKGEVNSNDIKFSPGDSESLRLTKGGNVGIGITNPPEKLTVSGQTRIQDNVQICGTASRFNSQLGFFRGTGSTVPMFSMGINPLTSANDKFDFNNINGNPTSFSFGGTEKVRITAGGSVGIGTTNPSTLLDVRGTGSFTKGTVRNIFTENTASGVSSISLTSAEFTECDSLVLSYTQVSGTVSLTLPAVNNSAYINKQWSVLATQDQDGTLTSISTINVSSTNATFIPYRTDLLGGGSVANTISITAGTSVSSFFIYLLSTSPDVYAIKDVMC